MTRLYTPIPRFFLDPDDIVTIRRRPDEKHVTLRLASQIVNQPMAELIRKLEESGKFQDERYAIWAHLKE